MPDNLIPVPPPGDLVTFTIFIEGGKIDPKYKIASVLVQKELNRIPTAKVIILDGDAAKEKFEVSDKDDFIPGKKIKIQVGYNSKEKTIFEGIIVKHSAKVRGSGSTSLSIECKDIAVKATIGRKNKYFYEQKDSDIIKKILGEHGLSVTCDATPVTHKEIVQYHSSDWDFVLTRAELNGLLVMVDDGKVEIKKPDFGQSPVVKPKFGATILEFDGEIDARWQYKKVKSSAWSHKDHKIITANGSAEAPSQGNITPAKLAEVASPAEFEIRHTGALTKDELKAWADAQLLKSRIAKIRGRVRFQGFADVKPAKVIEILGVSNRFNGKAFVGGVSHEIGEGNWLTDVQFGVSPEWFMQQQPFVSEQASSNIIPAINGLQVGIVVDLEDPDGEDRIQVRLPILDEGAKGMWMRVACVDAGKKRGTVFRPEKDDEVVVGFFNNDPRHGVILGQLHSSKHGSPIKGSNKNHDKGYHSRSDMQMLFNDEKKIMTFSTPAGNKIVISEDNKSITIQDQNGNKMVMDPSGIVIESPGDITIKAKKNIKTESTMNTEIKASMNGKMEASMNLEAKAGIQMKVEGAMTEVKASGITTVKGSLVQIN